MEQIEDEKMINVWNSILKSAISLPMIKVDRASFLRKELSLYLEADKVELAINGNPVDYIPSKIIDKISKGCISYHLTITCSLAAAAGIPGGFALLGTIPADVTQFYVHTFILTQKLLYLYGTPNLLDEKNELTDEICNILTIYVGVMFGSQSAIVASKKLLALIAENTAKKLPRLALTKTLIYPLVKQVGKFIGIKVTKDSFAKSASKIIPLIGAPISAGVTYWTFKPMANKLHRHLNEQIFACKEAFACKY